MLKSINHIGIAVKNLDESLSIFEKIFAFSDIHREIVEEQKVEIATFNIGEVKIELTAPTDENSPIAKFLDKKGEGIHHIAFESDDINSDLSRLSDEGIKLIDKEAKIGAHNMLIAFLHPKSTNSVLMEICQTK